MVKEWGGRAPNTRWAPCSAFTEHSVRPLCGGPPTLEAVDGAPAAEFPNPGDESLPIDSALIKVLAADSRRDILRLLKQRRMTLTELSGQLNLKKATVLEHLKKLTDANLIRRMEDERLWVYYELTRQGSRIVSPGKTRFYLIMSATALAGLLIGGIIVAALIYQAPHVVDVRPSEKSAPSHSVVDQSGVATDARPPAAPQSNATAEPTLGLQLEAPASAFRGLDDDLVLRVTRTSAPVDGSILLASPTASPITLYATDGVAHLRAVQLDSLAAANYTVQFAPSESNATWTSLGSLDVREPAIVVAPLWTVEDASTAYAIHLSDPTKPVVAFDAAPVALESTAPGAFTFTAPAAPAGTSDITVGRLYHATIEVAPNATIEVGRWDGSTWPIHVLRNGTAAPGATVLFGAMAPQTTDPGGAARLAPTGAAAQLLRVTFPDGASISRALRVDERAVTIDDPTVQVDSFRATTLGDSLAADAALSNRGTTDARIQLTLVVDGAPLASQLATVRAGATSTTFTMRAPIALASGAHQAELAIAPGPLARVTGGAQPATADATTPQSNGSSAAPAPTMTTPMQPYSLYEDSATFGRSTSAASTTFFVGQSVPTTTTVAATTTSAPASYAPAKAPGAPLAITLALALALALALRRRR